MSATDQTQMNERAPTRWTTLDEVVRRVVDEPETGARAWLRTTAGVVVLLVALQLFTGLLLACYYVPATDDAHTTVAFIEKAVSGGSWLRALHVYGSVLLPCALVLHLAQKLWRGSPRRRPLSWLASVALLALVFAAGGTGYALSWDARAYYTTHVAEGLVRGLPLIGARARLWLLGGPVISTLTLSRFFALHALLIPFMILCVIVARLFILRERNERAAIARTHDTKQSAQTNDAQTNEAPTAHAPSSLIPHPSSLSLQLARNSVVVALVFLALAFYAAKYPAPFGPRADAVPAEYLPRPGAQFLWLFELLKHTAGAGASFVGLILPGLLFALLALIPWLERRGQPTPTRRAVGLTLVGFIIISVIGLTALALYDDTRDPRTRDQLARQTAAEEAFRRAPFIPQRPRATDKSNTDSAADTTNTDAQTNAQNTPAPPAAYTQHCAKCHGAHGEGVRPHPKLIGISAQPHRTIADLIAIINDPAAYGLEKPMTSFANKLTDDEKRQIAEWIAGLK